MSVEDCNRESLKAASIELFYLMLKAKSNTLSEVDSDLLHRINLEFSTRYPEIVSELDNSVESIRCIRDSILNILLYTFSSFGCSRNKWVSKSLSMTKCNALFASLSKKYSCRKYDFGTFFILEATSDDIILDKDIFIQAT